MSEFKLLIICLWVALLLYWLASAFRTKRNSSNTWLSVGIRIIIIFVVFLFLRIPLLNHFVMNIFPNSFYTNLFIGSIGVFIFILGFVLLIWARIYLGNNWGEPMTVKVKPELVTKGPYAFIRHPIYAGFIIAMLGTTIVISTFYLIPFVCLSAYFVYSLKIEEKDMLRQFSKEYKEYKKKTRALVPFIY
jgi:protein-S-isoprenylcysteine O-methyltransferase Ste14